MNKEQNRFTFLLEFAKTFAESCRKISEINTICLDLAAGKISLEEFSERRRLILEGQSG